MIASLLFKKNNKPIILHEYQQRIADAILTQEKKVLIWAATRAGKSFTVALATLITAIVYDGLKIRIIAPTENHARIIMNYIIEHLTDHPLIVEQLPFQVTTQERLKKTLSKNKITFKNGSEIMILSATLSAQGRGIVGFGGDMIIVDEAEQIPADIIREKIMRMLGDNPNASIILLGNPVNKGYMYEQSRKEGWVKIRIGWKECVKAGRFTQEFVEERKADLSPEQFTIWYEAEYPSEYEDTLIPWDKINESVGKFSLTEGDYLVSCDVAEYGEDSTVITVARYHKGYYHVERQMEFKKTDPFKTAERLVSIAHEKKAKAIIIDDTGGSYGVARKCRELSQRTPFRVIGKRFGNRPEDPQFLNVKTELYWKLRNLFLEGRISIPNNSILKEQLNQARYETTSTGKLVILDAKHPTNKEGIRVVSAGKSPDHADSLALLTAWKPSVKFALAGVKRIT